MKYNFIIICALSFCMFSFNQVIASGKYNDQCVLPPDLSVEVSKKYPGSRVVTISDLNKDHRKMFIKDHGERCPGLVNIDFYGDGKPTWALALITGESFKRKAHLIVAQKISQEWKIRTLEVGDGSIAPVIWSEAPGEYHDVYKQKTVRATKPVIIFCGYESWAILYAWVENKRVAKIWLSD